MKDRLVDFHMGIHLALVTQKHAISIIWLVYLVDELKLMTFFAEHLLHLEFANGFAVA